jgi:Domain of unknown function (DUF3387)
VDRLEALVAVYNTGTLDAERFFEALKQFVEQMMEEERRAAREELTERELAVFDLLTRPTPTLTKAREKEVKKVAKAAVANSIPTLGAPRAARPALRDQVQAERATGQALPGGALDGEGRGGSSTTTWAAKDRARGLRRPSVVLVEGALGADQLLGRKYTERVHIRSK